jgi:hypothetical protein
MSRSYKKTAGWTDHKSPWSKIAKRFANKNVRNAIEIPNGGAYKKFYCSWNICDYKFLYFSKKEVKRDVGRIGHYRQYRYYMK